ncbi:zinc finger protein 512 isoform X2 [Mauremys mutica]|uniref:zinc finger protein 512 isoform X2 n=1 Tax=Mauremys mutica TaxID=74926 RepID=UPI001D162407|nr:zinc finger protein 512 isoform X2 [Mauremys mutica]
MRGIKTNINKSSEKKGESPSRGKRKSEREDDEDYEEFSRKKQKVPARKKQRAGVQQNPKSKGRYVRKEPPTYAAGSMEEQWYLEILSKGRVTCPTCRAVVRKTVEGLKKHMANCRQEMFTCHHCGKQLRSLAGMKYHIMADHNNLPVVKEGGELDEQCERDRLRKVLKRMGKLKCMREGCTGSFTSIMGYLYHMKKCGKEASELEKMAMKCRHCGKAYKSKAGLVYHLRSEHGPVTFLHEEERPESLKEMTLEPSSAGRVQRKSAKVAVYYLHELANEELAKEWPKKKVLQDLVPDDRKGCESVYGSVSGLKSHLGTCTLGDFVAGKYKCLLCEKEFISESGVKYHINSVHAEDWFDVNTTNKKSFEKLMKIRQREDEQRKQRKKCIAARSRKKRPGIVSAKKLLGAGAERSRRRSKRGHSQLVDNESRSSEEEEEEPQAAQRAETPKTIRKRGRK